MEIPEPIEKSCMEKKVVVDLGQLSSIIECAMGIICEEIGAKYNPGSYTTKKIIRDAIIRAASKADLLSEMA